MPDISKKKVPFLIKEDLYAYLKKYNRYTEIPIHYGDLRRYAGSIPLYDKEGEDTLWVTVYYSYHEVEAINDSLKKIYAILKAYGDMSIIEHVYIDRVDLCTYGNTQPFRVRVVNRINDNFDYFYVKNADSSRIYGLELEEILSPNRVPFLVHNQTLVEEHIAGIPGDQFIKYNLSESFINKTRLAKEFVKFNERCFVRLLGDMHSSNFVIDLTPDFEEINFRIRAIDFDQQSYEGRRAIYMPKLFKQNNEIIQIGIESLTPKTVLQYQAEERSLMAHRGKSSYIRLFNLIRCMKRDTISTEEKEKQLAEELSEFYKSDLFMKCKNMGEIVECSLFMLDDFENVKRGAK